MGSGESDSARLDGAARKGPIVKAGSVAGFEGGEGLRKSPWQDSSQQTEE